MTATQTTKNANAQVTHNANAQVTNAAGTQTAGGRSPAHPRAGRSAAGGTPDGVTLGRVVRSELIKLRSVRSTVFALLSTVLLIVGVAAVMSIGVLVEESPDGFADAPTAEPAGAALTGISSAVWAVAILAILAVTSEYASGTIRVSIAAVPRRTTLLLGKAIAVGAATLVTTLVATMTAFFTAKAILAIDGVTISLTSPGVMRALVGAALYLTVVSALAMGFAWLLRSTAGALASLFGVIAMLPLITLFLPHEIGATVSKYLPDSAGTAIMALPYTGGQLPPWAGLGLFTAYAAIVLGLAAVLLRRRDA